MGGIPGNWGDAIGLPCEIVPLIKPYGLWTGNVFQGQILSKGKPVPHATVEVEFLGHEINLKKNRFEEDSSIEYPRSALVTQTIKADVNGIFTYGIPKEGWWGFAALGVGPEKQYKGKELSQDAVFWIEAVDID